MQCLFFKASTPPFAITIKVKFPERRERNSRVERSHYIHRKSRRERERERSRSQAMLAIPLTARSASRQPQLLLSQVIKKKSGQYRAAHKALTRI